MNKAILFVFGVFLFCGVATAATYDCWQENAKQSTSCGGLNTGNYSWTGTTWSNITRAFDNNWLTSTKYSVFANGDFYPTFAKPLNAANTSKLKISAGTYLRDVSIPQQCFVQPQLKFRISINKDGCPTCTNRNLKTYCWDGTSWYKMSFGNSGANILTNIGMAWKINIVPGTVQNTTNVTCQNCVAPPASTSILYGKVTRDGISVANLTVKVSCNGFNKTAKTSANGDYSLAYSAIQCTVYDNYTVSTTDGTYLVTSSALVESASGCGVNIGKLDLNLPICSVGTKKCGIETVNQIMQCTNGYSWNTTLCEYGCSDTPGTVPKCNVCEQNSLSCRNGNTIDFCTGSNWIQNTTCEYGCKLDENTCKVCEAGAKTCAVSSSELSICKADGSGFDVTNCQYGCDSETNSCRQPICIVNETKCLDEENISICTDGFTWEPKETCDYSCSIGSKVCKECSTGDTQCKFNTEQTDCINYVCKGTDGLSFEQTCGDDGMWETELTSCSTGCGPFNSCSVCEPYSRTCNGNVLETCNNMGYDSTSKKCEFGCDAETTWCNICAPGTNACFGNEVKTCLTNGRGWDDATVETCENGCHAGKCTTEDKCNPSYDDVLLVTNINSEISKNISDYFIEKRGITHQVFINVTASESISYANYNKSIRQVIEKYLVDNNLQNEINYIVTTKGVPLKTTWTAGMTNGYKSIDNMLVSILTNSTDSGSYVSNPVYNKAITDDNIKQTYNIYLVTRLDGRNIDDIKKLIPEKTCNELSGKVLLDRNPSKTGGYLTWDKKIEVANNVLIARGYATLFDNTSGFVVNKTNLDGYYSWGSNDKGSCDAISNSSAWGFTFNPGSIGDTGVSTSGRTFDGYWSRAWNGTAWVNCSQSLTADLISMGISGTKGYVAEPYTTALSEPDITYDRYTNGYNIAQALYMSSQVINWMDVYIGDPKVNIQANTVSECTINQATCINENQYGTCGTDGKWKVIECEYGCYSGFCRHCPAEWELPFDSPQLAINPVEFEPYSFYRKVECNGADTYKNCFQGQWKTTSCAFGFCNPEDNTCRGRPNYTCGYGSLSGLPECSGVSVVYSVVGNIANVTNIFDGNRNTSAIPLTFPSYLYINVTLPANATYWHFNVYSATESLGWSSAEQIRTANGVAKYRVVFNNNAKTYQAWNGTAWKDFGYLSGAPATIAKGNYLYDLSFEFEVQ